MSENIFRGKRNKTKTSLQEELDLLGRNINVVGDYEKAKIKTTFSCRECGCLWDATPNGVLRGTGCPECAGKRWDTNKLQNYLNQQGKTFRLLSGYTGMKSYIRCECVVCGYIQETTPDNLKNSGCASCSNKVKSTIESLQKTLDELKTGVTVAGKYVNKGTGVSCECNICGLTWTTPPSVLKRGSSCPSCASGGFNPARPAYLYYLRVEDQSCTYWKIGITGKRDLKNRFCSEDLVKITVLYSYLFEHGMMAREAEKNILHLFSEYRVRDSLQILKTGGNTELFYKDVLQMDHLGGRRC